MEVVECMSGARQQGRRVAWARCPVAFGSVMLEQQAMELELELVQMAWTGLERKSRPGFFSQDQSTRH